MEPVLRQATLEGCTTPPDPPPALDEKSYTYDDVADFKRVKKKTVMKWVREGSIPSPVYTGGTARFTANQVATIITTTLVPGTYVRGDSIKSKRAKRATAKRMKAKGKPPKKKPAPKKPKPKKKARK